ncbi:segregation and condensation protein B [Allopseudospirillum japonicum]|uniref:Segregation and condensation protein B n=1 Tax=Allopseudospirillum japonicum TaxID=64971 RepID=A0A1H6THA7_9GAMM|nr:SMC-Scp complex subunit ScpB [Allopseudospirillum japonicum]SEI79463.1 segregation and condensation protein B [Allopseudospirillum japonicum]
MSQISLVNLLEALLLATAEPLSLQELNALVAPKETSEETPFPLFTRSQVQAALQELAALEAQRPFRLQKVASGYRLQLKAEYSPWLQRMAQTRPPRYSRALLETLALIAYRQPLTRTDIEQVRGVSVSSQIIHTLEERGWIRIIGQRDTPGRPNLYATTRQFLDDFNLQSLEELPALDEIRSLDELDQQWSQQTQQQENLSFADLYQRLQARLAISEEEETATRH